MHLFSIILAGSLAVSTTAFANSPCSGKKGGIDHCEGSTFICNDGSVSASKKSCSATMGTGTGALGIAGAQQEEMSPTASSDCSCRSATYCTGPKGGHFCTTDTGGKSYLRKD